MFKSTALGSFILSIFDDFFLVSSALSLFNFTFPDISILFFSGSSEYISAFSLTSPTVFLPYKIPPDALFYDRIFFQCTIGQSFSYMMAGDHFLPFHIGDGTCHFQKPVIGSGTE